MCVNNLPKVTTQWNSGATRDSNRGRRVLIPSALTARPRSYLHIVQGYNIQWIQDTRYNGSVDYDDSYGDDVVDDSDCNDIDSVNDDSAECIAMTLIVSMMTMLNVLQ